MNPYDTPKPNPNPNPGHPVTPYGNPGHLSMNQYNIIIAILYYITSEYHILLSIFAGANFHRIAIHVFRRNFCGSKFRASTRARPHLGAILKNFAVPFFAAVELSAKIMRFCTMRKFPTIYTVLNKGSNGP